MESQSCTYCNRYAYTSKLTQDWHIIKYCYVHINSSQLELNILTKEQI